MGFVVLTSFRLRCGDCLTHFSFLLKLKCQEFCTCCCVNYCFRVALPVCILISVIYTLFFLYHLNTSPHVEFLTQVILRYCWSLSGEK